MTVWTDSRVATLKAGWALGKSANAIADELGGTTRNAVIGKAHRLGLKGRESPIKYPEPIDSRPPHLRPEKIGCEWPFHDVGHPDFHFCGAEQMRGKSYCEAHFALSVRRVYLGAGQ